MRSLVAVPLFIQGQRVGALILESARWRAFAPDHIAIASEVSASLAVAIRQARLYEQGKVEIDERKQPRPCYADMRLTWKLGTRNWTPLPTAWPMT